MDSLSRRRLLAGLSAAVAGCSTDRDATPTTGTGGTVTVPSGDSVGYPHLRPSGNRAVSGRGGVPDTDPLSVSLDATPTWLAAVPAAEGSVWAVVDGSDTLSTVAVRGGGVDHTVRGPWPAERPPVVRRRNDAVDIVEPPTDASPHAPPLVLDTGVAAVAENGDVIVDAGGRRDRIGADLLPDARLCRTEPGAAVALGDPTSRYDHGALGDGTEASGIVVLDLEGAAVERRTEIPEGRVVEGTAPIVATLGGEQAFVVTESDASDGARLAAYDRSGDRIAESDPIGAGFRWRHQIAVAPFGPGGGTELAAVETPHIGGTAEFFRHEGDRLERVATVSGASSHAYRSRNLDGGLAADADGDGRTELVVPDDDRRQLRAIERRGDEAVGEWSVPVGGPISTNVVGVAHGDGMAVGVGQSGGELRLWLPR